jgi:hypothetical protein
MINNNNYNFEKKPVDASNTKRVNVLVTNYVITRMCFFFPFCFSHATRHQAEVLYPAARKRKVMACETRMRGHHVGVDVGIEIIFQT